MSTADKAQAQKIVSLFRENAYGLGSHLRAVQKFVLKQQVIQGMGSGKAKWTFLIRLASARFENANPGIAVSRETENYISGRMARCFKNSIDKKTALYLYENIDIESFETIVERCF